MSELMINLVAQVDGLTDLWDRAVVIWLAGGWAMIAIAVIAVVMFSLGVNVYMKLWAKGFHRVRESRWRRWLDHAGERRGPIGELIAKVDEGRSLEEIKVIFQEIRAEEVAPFDRDLRVMQICVGAAPLVGLLGTVTGMLATFAALASGSGGEQTMGEIAGGISEALITTMTGLVIALPGLFFQYQLVRRHERYKAFIAHLETVCSQRVYKRERAAA